MNTWGPLAGAPSPSGNLIRVLFGPDVRKIKTLREDAAVPSIGAGCEPCGPFRRGSPTSEIPGQAGSQNPTLSSDRKRRHAKEPPPQEFLWSQARAEFEGQRRAGVRGEGFVSEGGAAAWSAGGGGLSPSRSCLVVPGPAAPGSPSETTELQGRQAPHTPGLNLAGPPSRRGGWCPPSGRPLETCTLLPASSCARASTVSRSCVPVTLLFPGDPEGSRRF